MIEALLPGDAVAVEAYDDAVPAPLFPEEERALGDAVPKRRLEFATARRCARSALAGLGFPAAPIPAGASREPCWPPGVVGTITHCSGYRAAVVAWSKRLLTVGVDAEPHGPLPPGALESIALDSEVRALSRLHEDVPGIHWDRLLFSAKESVYKAWFPLARRWLDFDSAVVTFDARARTFRARLLVPGPVVDGRKIIGFDGRWMVADGLVLTAIAVPALARAAGYEREHAYGRVGVM
nr:4'-phosphopantetheinyl transferase [Catenulispora sp.]